MHKYSLIIVWKSNLISRMHSIITLAYAVFKYLSHTIRALTMLRGQTVIYHGINTLNIFWKTKTNCQYNPSKVILYESTIYLTKIPAWSYFHKFGSWHMQAKFSLFMLNTFAYSIRRTLFACIVAFGRSEIMWNVNINTTYLNVSLANESSE